MKRFISYIPVAALFALFTAQVFSSTLSDVYVTKPKFIAYTTIQRVPYTGATRNVDLGHHALEADAVIFDNHSISVDTIGTLYWNDRDKTLSIKNTLNTTLDLGHEEYVRVVNKTGAIIADGRAVYISGAQGNRPTAAYGIATSLNKSKIIGVATENITSNEEGTVTVHGVVHGFNTSSFTAGDKLYLSPTQHGILTATVPSTPYYATLVAIALNSTNNGSIYVNPSMPLALDTSLRSDANTVAASQQAVRTALANYTTQDRTVRGSNTNFNNLSTVRFRSQKLGLGTGSPRGAFDMYSGSGANSRRAYFGGSTNFGIFDAALGLRYANNSATTTWDDLRIEPTVKLGSVGAGTNPDFREWPIDAACTTLCLYQFNQPSPNNFANAQRVFMTAQMPHSWTAITGSTVSPHIHFTQYSGAYCAAQKTPAWAFKYRMAKIGGTFSNATTIYAAGNAQLTPTLSAGQSISHRKHYIAEFPDIITTSEQAGISAILIGTLFRAAWTSADECLTQKFGLTYVDLHYAVDSTGSDEEYSKISFP